MLQMLRQEPDEIGAHSAVTDVPEEYSGSCALFSSSGRDQVIAVFPCSEDAFRAARYAITPDGGYGSVYVSAAPGAKPTHESFDDWAFR